MESETGAVELPQAVELYLRAEAANDPEMLRACFAMNGRVRDGEREYDGIDTIIEWKRATHSNGAALEVGDRFVERDVVRLRVRAPGVFEARSAEATYEFNLVEGKIALLRIQPAA